MESDVARKGESVKDVDIQIIYRCKDWSDRHGILVPDQNKTSRDMGIGNRTSYLLGSFI